MQLFIGVIFDFAAMMGQAMHIYEKSLLMASLFTYTVVLVKAAHKGSRVISKSLETESHMWTHLVTRTGLLSASERWEVAGVLRFREEWDALEVACFTSNLGNFSKFLSTTITCVAVVLQFDYKAVRCITNLARGDNSTQS